MKENSPPEPNWFVAMLIQLLKGRFTFVAVSTAQFAPARPLVPLTITFVPDTVMPENFGCGTAITSIELSERKLTANSRDKTAASCWSSADR